MLHYEAGELIGANITSLFATPHETLPALIRAPSYEPLGTEHFSGELSARCKDGSIITTFTQVSLITFLERRYLLCVQDDITDTKRWQSALIESEHRFRTMANSLPVLIWTADHTKCMTWANSSLLDFAGVSLEQKLGTAFIERIHPDDREMYVHRTRASLRDDRELQVEYRLRRFDGNYRWIWEHGIPLYEAEHTLTGYIGAGIDITDRKEAEQARSRLLEAERAARTQIERASQIKDEFLATLSHELRTPLNAILGWSHLIRRDALDPQRLALGIEIIEKNARAQAKMIEDLLDMSRIISGKVRIEPKPTEVYQALISAIESVTPTASAKGLEIQVHSDTDLGTVQADPHRLQQILLNLLSNAVRFSKQGGVIDVTATVSDDAVAIAVQDHGEGIRPEFLPHVFDRFRQADSSTTRKHSGLGLGLAIVKHLVALHGGHVEAESAGAGCGATFTVTLPLILDRSEPLGPSSLLAPLPAVQAPSTHHALDGIRVLAVDDEPDARNLLKVILEEEGASVTTASSCQGALDAVEECLPDLIVSDIGMPGEDGYQFIRKLRAREPEHGGSVPAIALTAFARPEDRDCSLAAGFQAHMAKPVEPSALVQTVVQMLPG
jgi:PAS domain S-box-containing protein